jgi:hypothetical protein
MEPGIRELREDFALRKFPPRRPLPTHFTWRSSALAYNLITAFQRNGAGPEHSSAVSVHSGSTQRRASLCASLDIECNVVATHVSAAGQTRVNSPLPWGEGVTLWRCRQPERDG